MISTQAYQSSNDIASIKKFLQIQDNQKEGIINCPCILDGKFMSFMKPTASGQKEKVTGVAITAINADTFDKIDLIKAIAEGRVVNIVKNNGSIVEIHMHSQWLEIIRQKSALNLLLRVSLDKGYSHPKEAFSIQVGGLPTNSHYQGMVNALQIQKLIPTI